MPEEPTVLDFVKSLLTPWRGLPPPIPHTEITEDFQKSAGSDQEHYSSHSPEYAPPVTTADIAVPIPSVGRITFPFKALVAIGLALIAQISLEPGPDRTWGLGLALYLIAAVWVVWANNRKEWILPDIPFVELEFDPHTIRQVYMWIGAGLCTLAFYMFGGNRFTWFNLIIWFAAIICIIYAFWIPNPERVSLISRIGDALTNRKWEINLSRWTFVVLAISILVVFFRVYRLNNVPPEMFSDHAEKLLDVWDILHGNPQIFFPRNTGREAIQMYLTAGIVSLFGTGYTFTSLKLGTTLAGLVTLPFVYLLGKEIANKRVGLISVVITGIAYWPNVITRVGLRFTLYPLFVAPVLYFLIRGIRRSSRNDFILAGLALGLGLHGYSPFRVVPIVAIVAVVLFLLHSESKGLRKRTILYTGLLVLISLVIFLPLLRVWIDSPGAFWFRALTRVGTIERPLPGPAWQIFLENLRNAMTMFGWDNGEIWPVSVVHRPALDAVSAALFYLGIILILVRYVRGRNWLDLFLFLSIPLLLLPSILSLAFPSENPTLNRAAGAFIPVFIVVGLALDGLIRGLESHSEHLSAKALAWVIGIGLLVWSGYQNYDLVFHQYQNSYSESSWNTTELGQVIREFTNTIGEEENAYVIPYPHWVDTRLVGMNAGFPTRDFAIWPEDLPNTLDNQGPQMFIVKFDDTDSITALQNLYPQGILVHYTSELPNKDFYQFYVLPK